MRLNDQILVAMKHAAREALSGTLIATFLAGWGNSAEGYNAEFGPLLDDVADTARDETKEFSDIASRKAIDAFLSALSAEGLAIVPRTPTDEMIAATEALDDPFLTDGGQRKYIQDVWSVMLSAAGGK